MGILRVIREELRALDLSLKALRRFGFLIGGIGFLVIVWLWYRHGSVWVYLLVPDLLLILLGAIAPRWLRPIYLIWMSFAFGLGLVMSHVLLTLFFFGVVTPIGLLARWTGRDFLRLRRDLSVETYWIKREPQSDGVKERCRNQF